MPLVFIFLWILTAGQLTYAALDDQPYCAIRYKRLCQGKGRHVACQFPDPGSGASCVNYTAIKFNNDMKNFILHYVNRRRQRIASGSERVRGGLHLPKPELMMFVEWDRELAFLAQRLADQCHFVHDDCRATVRYPYAGQTVGEVRWRTTGEPVDRGARRAIRRVLDAWWGERRRVSPHQLTAPFRVAARGAVWGHFSQLCVWGLQAMGCGAVHHGLTHPRLLLVCDFSHTNMLGQRTLTPGSLAPCPIHTMRRPRAQYPLLCAPVRQPAPQEPEEETYDEDEDFDPGLTVELGEAPTPSIKYTRSTRERDESITQSYSAGSPALVFREDLKLRTKGLMIEKLDRELDVRNKAEDKSQVTEEHDIQEWRNGRTFGQWREHPERFEKVIPLEHQSTDRTDLSADYYRPKTLANDPDYMNHLDTSHLHRFLATEALEESATNWAWLFFCLVVETDLTPPSPFHQRTSKHTAHYHPYLENYPRHRWKQTRDRPLRPGANALLVSQPHKSYSRRQSVASLMLDKDDIDQFFRDTGFQLSWKKD